MSRNSTVTPFVFFVFDSTKVAGLTAASPDGTAGMRLLDQYGQPTAKTVPEHETAREFMWDHIKRVVTSGQSAWTKP